MLMYDLHFTNRISRLLDSEIKEFEREVNIQITAVVCSEKYRLRQFSYSYIGTLYNYILRIFLGPLALN